MFVGKRENMMMYDMKIPYTKPGGEAPAARLVNTEIHGGKPARQPNQKGRQVVVCHIHVQYGYRTRARARVGIQVSNVCIKVSCCYHVAKSLSCTVSQQLSLM